MTSGSDRPLESMLLASSQMILCSAVMVYGPLACYHFGLISESFPESIIISAGMTLGGIAGLFTAPVFILLLIAYIIERILHFFCTGPAIPNEEPIKEREGIP